MATLTLTAGAKPVFLSQNRFNRHADEAGDLAASTQNSLRHRLYDMDPGAYWSSSGSNDAVQESVVAGLWDSGLQGLYDVDFFAVLGHNLKNFTVEFSANNGSTWPNSYPYTAEANSYTLKTLASSIQANKFRVLMNTTQTANQEKQVGTIIVALSTLQAPSAMHLYNRRPPRVKHKTAVMHDGSIRRSYVYRSDASPEFFEANCGFLGLTTAQADSLESILLTHVPFIFAPEPGDLPSQWFQGQCAPGTYTRNYITLSKSGGWAVAFDFEETGGA